MQRLAFAILIAGLAGVAPAFAQDGTPQQAQPQVSPQEQPAPPPAAAEPAMPRPPIDVPPPVVTPPPAAVPAPPAPQASAPPPAPAEEARYSFHRVQDSFVRLDSRTGQVSICGRGSGTWTCQAVPDERTALESEIGRLQGDNAALKKELLAHNLELPSGVRADPAPTVAGKSDAAPSVQTPSDADLDRVMGFMEKVWRRMVEMMMSIQRDMQRKS